MNEAISTNVEMIVQYGQTMVEIDRQTAIKLGYSYLLFTFDIINNNGVVEPVYNKAFVRDLNDVYRLVKQKLIDLTAVHIVDVETGLEVDHSVFKKGE